MPFSAESLEKAISKRKVADEQAARPDKIKTEDRTIPSGSGLNASSMLSAIQARKKTVPEPTFARVRTEAAQNVNPKELLPLQRAAAEKVAGATPAPVRTGNTYLSKRMSDMGMDYTDPRLQIVEARMKDADTTGYIAPGTHPTVDQTSPYLSKRISDMAKDTSEDVEKYRVVTRPIVAIGAAVPTWVANQAETLRIGNEWALEHNPNGPSISDYALEQYYAGNLEGAAKAVVENYLRKQQQAKDSVDALKDFADRWSEYGQQGMEYATEGLDQNTFGGLMGTWSLQGLNSVTQNMMDVAAAQAMGIGTIGKASDGVGTVTNSTRSLLANKAAANAGQVAGKAAGLFNYIPFGERSFGASAGEARRANADLSTQLDYAVKNTVKEIATEMMWSTGDIFGVGGFDDLAEKGVRNLVRKSAASGPMREVLSTAASLGMAFTTEAFEEVVGTLAEEFYLKQLLDPDAEPPTGWDLAKALIESGMIGGLSGMMMGGGNVLSQNLDARINQTIARASEIIAAAENSGSEEAKELAAKVKENADKGYIASDLQELEQMTAQAEYEKYAEEQREAVEERARNPYRDMDTEAAEELIRRGKVYESQRAAQMNPKTASAAGLQDIARQIYEAENETGKSDTVRKAVEEAKKGAVSDAAAEEILKSPQATEYFGVDVTDNMTEAEKTNAVKAAAETVAEAEIRAEEARKAAEKTTTQSEEKPLSTGQFLDEIKDTLGESGQGAFSRVVGDGAGPMTRQAVADRAMAATLIYNAGTNGTAIESIRIENNPLTADEMSAMYSAGVKDGKQSSNRTGQRQNDLAASERSREISQRAREARARRQGAEVQRAAVRAAVKDALAVSSEEIGLKGGSNSKNLKVLPRESRDALGKHDRNAVDQLEKKGFEVVLVVSADGNDIGGLLEDADGKHYRGAIQGKKIFLTADHWNLSVEQVARHEFFHNVLENNPALRQAIIDKLNDTFTAAEVLAMQEAYAADYNWSGVDADYVIDEILCDAFGGIDIFEDKHLFPLHVTDYSEVVREMAKGADNKNATNLDRNGYSEDNGIYKDMLEKERYKILEKIKAPVCQQDNATTTRHTSAIIDLQAIHPRAKSKAQSIINPLAESLGILNRPIRVSALKNECLFSKGNGLSESLTKQLKYGGGYTSFAKALMNMDALLESAVLIEQHHDKYADTIRENPYLERVSVLVGLLRDGAEIIPVQFEIKHMDYGENYLYMTVALTKIKAGVLGSDAAKNGAPRNLLPTFTYKLSDIFTNVNPADGEFLKYVPDKFLNAEQIVAKKQALKEERIRIERYREMKKERDAHLAADGNNKSFRGSEEHDATGRALSEGQAEFFKDSKIRDKNGRLMPVYHGTDVDFNIFDTKVSGGKNGAAEGFGIYLADNLEVSESYGGRIINAYANVKRPATSWNKTIKAGELSKLIRSTCMREAQHMVEDGEYDSVSDALKDTWVSNYVYTYEYASMDAVYREVANQILKMNENDMNVVQEVMAGMSIRSYNAAMDFYREHLTPVTGIDGFWTTWKDANSDKTSNIILAFDSNQIKNVDNLNPTADPDIRYSQENPRLTEEDFELYASTGVTHAKRTAIRDGKRIILTSDKEIHDYIAAALKGKEQATAAYAKIGKRLAEDILRASDGTLNLAGGFIELVSNDIQHARNDHQFAKYADNIDLPESVFYDIPDLIDGYSEVISVITTSKNNTFVHLGVDTSAGKAVLVLIASKKRLSVHPKTLYGVTDEAYSEVTNKKRNVPNSRGARKLTKTLPDGNVPADTITDDNLQVKHSEELSTFSARMQQSQDELERLQQDLALSQAEVAYWKQARTTGTHVVNKADVKRVSNDVLKKWDATVKAGEITGRMEELADCLYQGMGIDEVLPLALDIADDICSSAKVIADGEAYETYKDIRKYFRENKIKRVDGIGDPGFYKRNFGKIRFANEGHAVDEMWDEWQSRWGIEFFPDDITTSQDKLLHLAEVIDSIESLYENPYSRDYAEAVEECAYSLMDDIMSGGVRYEPVMLTSANGRAASEYNRTIAEKNRQIEQLQKANEKTVKYYKEREARAKELLKQVRERRDERIDELKRHYKEVAMGKRWRRAESEARKRLQRVAKRLQNKKLPAVSKALLGQYIDDLDTAALSITGKKLDELKDLQVWYSNKKATDPDFIANPEIEKKLARINQKRISELSIDEVVELTQVLLNIENTINTERQMIDSEDRRDIYAQGLETIDDIMDAKGTKANLRDWIVSNTLSPVRAVRRFTGYAENSPLYKAVESLADGQRKMFDYQMRAARLFDTWVKDKKYTKTLQDEITITGFKNGVPTDVKITRDMAIALYMHSKNDQNLAHISDGGVTIPDLKALKKDPANAYGQDAVRIKMSPAMVKQIAGKLTAQDKAYAAAAAKYFDTMAQMEINEVSEKLVGYSLAQVENYFPINTDANFTRKEFESLQMDGTIEGMGFLKERTDAKNPIYLRGFSEVLNKSIDMNSKYVGLAIPVRNFNKLWNVTTADYSDADNIQHFTGSVKEAMNKKWGKRGVNYIEKMMTDLQNANVKSDELDSLLGKVRSNYAGAVLTLNLSVAIKQAASYPTAGAVLGGKALAKALANPKADPNLIAKYTPLYWYRSQGFADQELGDLKRRNRQIPKLLNWIQAADMATTRTLWKASEYYVRDNNKNLQIGTDAYYQEVARIYNRVIEETQPNYTTMQRPQLLRSDSSMVQSIAMFKTQPFQNFNVLYDAVGEYEALARAKKAGSDVDLKPAARNVRRAIGSQVVQLAVFSAMTFIWNMIRRKHDKYEDEEGEMTAASTFKGIGKDMISGSFSMVPFGSNLYELMDSIVNGSQYYGFDSVTITALDDTATAIINQWNLVKDATGTVIDGGTPDWNAFRIKTKKNLNSISKLAGIPVENVNNLYEAAYHWTAVYSEGEYMGEYRYLRLTVSPASSKVKYYALLKKAWLNDQKAFDQLQQEMLDSGDFTEKGINQKISSWKKELGE